MKISCLTTLPKIGRPFAGESWNSSLRLPSRPWLQRRSPMTEEPAARELDLAIEAADAGLWEWSVPEGTVRADERLRRLLADESFPLCATFDSFNESMHPNDAPVVAQCVEPLFHGRAAGYSVDYRVAPKDRAFRWITESAVATSVDSDGKPLTVVGAYSESAELFDTVRLESLGRS